ncbi:zwei Ig domain protein zig-8-like isoform X1 [Vespula maculifrons]|uniref:Zwei Ig domain protein zig-8-like isoform X1 n=1 Tax=Vespula maculifrons TaxID=7453 RepID=A0ABD2CPC5_VESMC
MITLSITQETTLDTKFQYELEQYVREKERQSRGKIYLSGRSCLSRFCVGRTRLVEREEVYRGVGRKWRENSSKGRQKHGGNHGGKAWNYDKILLKHPSSFKSIKMFAKAIVILSPPDSMTMFAKSSIFLSKMSGNGGRSSFISVLNTIETNYRVERGGGEEEEEEEEEKERVGKGDEVDRKVREKRKEEEEGGEKKEEEDREENEKEKVEGVDKEEDRDLERQRAGKIAFLASTTEKLTELAAHEWPSLPTFVYRHPSNPRATFQYFNPPKEGRILGRDGCERRNGKGKNKERKIEELEFNENTKPLEINQRVILKRVGRSSIYCYPEQIYELKRSEIEFLFLDEFTRLSQMANYISRKGERESGEIEESKRIDIKIDDSFSSLAVENRRLSSNNGSKGELKSRTFCLNVTIKSYWWCSKKAARNVVVIVAGYRGKVTKLKARKAPAIWRKSGKEISTSIREQMEKGVHCQSMLHGSSGKNGGDSSYQQNSLEDSSRSGPYFDKSASKNVTALLGKTTYLNCRVKNLGNKTFSPNRKD